MKKYNSNEKIFKIFNLIKENSKKKFNESIDVSINLSLKNSKNLNNIIYGSVLFPYKKNIYKNIVVFTNKSNFDIAYNSGAYFVGNNDLFNKIKNNNIKYDLVICTSDYVNIVSKLGYILGPKGLMPNINLGTITDNLKDTISDYIKGKIIYKSDKYGIIHISIGKINFPNKELLNNFSCLIDSILLNKFNKLKNNSFIKKINISSTMGKNYIINLN